MTSRTLQRPLKASTLHLWHVYIVLCINSHINTWYGSHCLYIAQYLLQVWLWKSPIQHNPDIWNLAYSSTGETLTTALLWTKHFFNAIIFPVSFSKKLSSIPITNLNGKDLAMDGKKILEDLHKSESKSLKFEIYEITTWSRPPKGKIKLNIDKWWCHKFSWSSSWSRFEILQYHLFAIGFLWTFQVRRRWIKGSYK